jgi:hypothetical protein
MSPLTRREFGKIVIAGVPLASLGLGATARATAAPALVFGVSTTSFHDLPRVPGTDNIDDVIRAMRGLGTTHIELDLANIEPAPPSTGSFIGGSPAYPKRITLTPDEILATNSRAREDLRAWRLRTGLFAAQAAQQKLESASLTVQACALKYDKASTDEEIDLTMLQAKALGVSTISSPMTMAMAARVAPFAEQQGISVAIHNQPDGNAAGLIAAPDLDAALALSKAFTLKLDVANITASNGDAVATLRRYQSRVAYVLLRDRLRNGGASQPFGEGDTPIAGVLKVLGSSDPAAPAIVEYDYVGLRASTEEVTASLAYLAKTLPRN